MLGKGGEIKSVEPLVEADTWYALCCLPVKDNPGRPTFVPYRGPRTKISPILRGPPTSPPPPNCGIAGGNMQSPDKRTSTSQGKICTAKQFLLALRQKNLRFSERKGICEHCYTEQTLHSVTTSLHVNRCNVLKITRSFFLSS